MVRDCQSERSVRSSPARRAGLAALACLLLLSAGACHLKYDAPNLPRIYGAAGAPRLTGKRPVIVIPGVLGSQLANRRTRQVVWPTLGRAEDDTLALPIGAATLEANCDEIVATEIVTSAPLIRFLPEIGVYSSLLGTLEEHGGYRRASLDSPPADGDRDTYYVFAYDWRRDNVESARLLVQKIAALKAKLGRPDLRFDVVAHSMGGLVARYAAMYGERDVLAAGVDAPGFDPRPDWAGARHFARLMLFGTPNVGSMDALSTVLLGYSVLGSDLPRLKLLSRLDRDAVFTLPSVYQLLPHRGAARFFDAKLAPLDVNIYDVGTWRRYGWSVACDKDFIGGERKRLLKERKGEKDEAIAAQVDEEVERAAGERERYLRLVLARAEAFHRALAADAAPPASLQWYLFGGDCEPTLDGAVIAEVKGKLTTFFRVSRAMGDRRLRRRAAELMFAPGDGRVTRRSLFGLPRELSAPASAMAEGDAPPNVIPRPVQATFHCEIHGDLPLNATVQNNLLTVLLGNSY
jgi:pimeloyl-ACP methyl ester carboxylesterase